MAEIQPDNLRNQVADEHPEIVEVESVVDSRQVEKGGAVKGKRKKVNKRSEVWNHFTEIVDKDGKDKAKCTWKFSHESVRRSLAEMIIVDEIPFSFVEKQGFRKFCQLALPPNFNALSRRTITRDCYSIYMDERLKLKSFFKGYRQRVSLTTDTWTSSQRISYMCPTTHYIDENWKLHKKILNFCPVESHKREELGDLLERCLKDWGIEEVYALTVDNASSNGGVVRVLRNALTKWGTAVLGAQDLHMRCAAHIINLVVGDGVNEEEMHKSVTAVKAAVKYIRQNPLRLKRFKVAVEFEDIETKKGLCLDVPTRWNSLYLMLDTAEKYEMAFERVVRFLKHFYYLTEKVSSSLYTISNLLFPEISEVDCLLKSWEKDVDVKDMAQSMREKFHKYWGTPIEMNKNIFHAVVLDPRNKLGFLEFLLIKVYGKEQGMQHGKMVCCELKRLFAEYKKTVSSGGKIVVLEGSTSASNALSESESKHKNKQQLKSAYKRFKIENGFMSEKTELDKYLGEDVEDDNDDFDLLGWWKLNAPRFPVLATMARDVLAFPISTVASELAFSMGGRVLDAFRSSLTPRMAQALICAQDWLRSKSRIVSEEEDLDLLDNLEKEFDKVHMDSAILE
ncbi:hypothetical protein SLEP1_g56319 [Rubroshorea leprosula]|uniref:Transposase n=1 Tax=Rubroshorea leprosula TaxID=152421 RepID=A0AAV5MJ97_9ROSI|nr:hypothetical protein SLEP1_g56319 [Rubroshorea leprosula]